MSKGTADETYCVFTALHNQGRYEEAGKVLSAFEDATIQCMEAFPSHKSFLLAILDAHDPSPESPLLIVHRGYIERREEYLRQLMEPTLQAYRK